MVEFETRLLTFSGSNAAVINCPVFVEFKKLPLIDNKQSCNASFKNMSRMPELACAVGALESMERKLDESPPLLGASLHKSDNGTLTNEVAAKRGKVTKLTQRTPVTKAAQCRQ